MLLWFFGVYLNIEKQNQITERNQAVTKAIKKIHRWEAAELGKAPFTFIGVDRITFGGSFPGDPIKPGSTCDYCGQAIMYVCQVRSSDGKSFKVGNECIRKIDEMPKIIADKYQREIKRQQANIKREQTQTKAAELIKQYEDNRDKFTAYPHPQKWAQEQGQTLADSIDWMIIYAGHARVIKEIKKAFEKLPNRQNGRND